MASHGVPRTAAAAERTERTEQARQKERQQIEQYKGLVALVNAKVADKQYTEEALALTSKLLSQNPEYYTVWNHRRVILQDIFRNAQGKEAVESEGLSTAQQTILGYIADDLRFTIPLLMKFPKCYWIWNHRQWLLQQSTELLPQSQARGLWQEELGLVGKMLSRDSRNFHGWSYRRFVVARLEALPSEDGQKTSMTEPEFEYTTKMINTNLSNFSAWHNRTKLIPRLLDERSADEETRRKFLKAEFELIQKALYTDPYDQSLWFYHANLMSALDEATPQNARIIFNLDRNVRQEFVEEELESIKDMLDGAEDCKWIYRALLDTAVALKQLREGNNVELDEEMAEWLSELRKLDPLRSGRWDDLSKKLKL
ncbi:uncharacterized protein J3D65DRAFT_563914 [Phyllosticta citribraziliensis]|uniref:Geranylgeranyl transferase type-2 subunit alpha n=1 Tax=Phyllosticta citribraziliensis TaxID=989973 RepID=A0ABR1MCS0_9PEZI